MPRTPTAFTDDQLHAICLALQQLAARYPDNRAFLRRAFDAIDRIAGRPFGETVYRRLLAAAGITRTPSTRTVQAVLAERRAAADAPSAPATLQDADLRAYLQREIRVTLQDLVPSAPGPSAAAPEGEGNAWLAEYCARLEAEQQQLRAELDDARERAATERARADTLQQQLVQATAATGARESELFGQLVRVSDELVALAARLEGAERRRAVETDAVRQAFREERAQLAARVERLENDLVVARQGLEVYRRRVTS